MVLKAVCARCLAFDEKPTPFTHSPPPARGWAVSEEGGAGKVLCGWPGKVVVVAVAYVGPEIKFFPLRSPNRFWAEACQVDGKVCVGGKFS